MALSSNVARDHYKNLSVEELENKYEEIKKNYCFHTKDEQIEFMIKNYVFDNQWAKKWKSHKQAMCLACFFVLR